MRCVDLNVSYDKDSLDYRFDFNIEFDDMSYEIKVDNAMSNENIISYVDIIEKAHNIKLSHFRDIVYFVQERILPFIFETNVFIEIYADIDDLYTKFDLSTAIVEMSGDMYKGTDYIEYESFVVKSDGSIFHDCLDSSCGLPDWRGGFEDGYTQLPEGDFISKIIVVSEGLLRQYSEDFENNLQEIYS